MSLRISTSPFADAGDSFEFIIKGKSAAVIYQTIKPLIDHGNYARTYMRDGKEVKEWYIGDLMAAAFGGRYDTYESILEGDFEYDNGTLYLRFGTWGKVTSSLYDWLYWRFPGIEFMVTIFDGDISIGTTSMEAFGEDIRRIIDANPDAVVLDDLSEDEKQERWDNGGWDVNDDDQYISLITVELITKNEDFDPELWEFIIPREGCRNIN